MKSILWLLTVAIAFGGGWIAARNDGATVRTVERRSDDGKAGGAPSHESKGRRGGKSAKSTPGQRSEQRRRSLDEALSRLRERTTLDFGDSDPFDHADLLSDQSRLFAAIYDAQEEDFPDILRYAWVGEGEPGLGETGNDWRGDLLAPMICRWCDFDPAAARAWLLEHIKPEDEPDPFGGRSPSTLQEFLATVALEAMDDRPEWSVSLLEDLLRAANPGELVAGYNPDPFSVGGVVAELNAFSFSTPSPTCIPTGR